MTSTTVAAPGLIGSGRGRAAAVLRDPGRSIIGPVADAVWIWGSPFWALAAIHLLLRVPFLNRDVTIGEPTTLVVFAMASITFAHLLPVFVRSHLNPAIRRTYPFRFWVVPPALVAALTLWPSVYAVAGVVAAFWDVYHTAQQNFGLGRIYDLRAGVADDRSRRADRLVSHLLYVGPILAGASLMDHVNELGGLDQVGWHWLATAPTSVEPRALAIRVVAIAVMAAGVVAYLLHGARLARQGVRSSPHKQVLMVSSAVVQVAAWGFSSPLVAFMVVNLYHAVQYFALVWHLEGRKAAAGVRVNTPRLVVPFGVLAVFVIPAAFGMAVSGVVTSVALVNAAFLSVSLLHFWMDGFIWSVRARAV